MITAALPIIAETQNQTKCPLTDEWTKMCCMFICMCIYVHYKNIYHEILLSIKNNEIMLSAAMFIDLKIIILSEIRQRYIQDHFYVKPK